MCTADSESTEQVSLEDQEEEDPNDDTLVNSAPTTPCDPEPGSLPTPGTPDKVDNLSNTLIFYFNEIVPFVFIHLMMNIELNVYNGTVKNRAWYSMNSQVRGHACSQ